MRRLASLFGAEGQLLEDTTIYGITSEFCTLLVVAFFIIRNKKNTDTGRF